MKKLIAGIGLTLGAIGLYKVIKQKNNEKEQKKGGFCLGCGTIMAINGLIIEKMKDKYVVSDSIAINSIIIVGTNIIAMITLNKTKNQSYINIINSFVHGANITCGIHSIFDTELVPQMNSEKSSGMAIGFLSGLVAFPIIFTSF